MGGKYEQTHRSIREATIAIVGEHGYDNVTIDQICGELNISRATFYYHFSGKDDVIADYFINEKGKMTPERLAKIFESESINERIIRVPLASFDPVSDPRRLELYQARGKYLLAHPGPENLERFDWMRTVLAPLIQQAQQTGEIRNATDAEQVAETVVTLFLGVRHTWCISNGAFDRAKVMRKTMETLLDTRPDLRVEL